MAVTGVTELGKLRLKNYVYFKDAEFDFSYKGISLILARNLDAGPDSTNGAGKSLLFGALPDIVFDEQPTGKDLKSTSKIESWAAVDIKRDGKVFTAIKHLSPTRKFQLLCDGHDLSVKGIPYAKKRLAQLIGHNEEEFYALDYLDAKKYHPLVKGSDRERLAFFTKVFRLEGVDTTKRLLLVELRRIQRDKAAYNEVKVMFDEAKKNSLPAAEIKVLQSQLEQYQTQVEDLASKVRDGQSAKFLVDFAESKAHLVSRYIKVTRDQSFDEWVASVKKKRKIAKAQEQVLQEWKAYVKALKRYKQDAGPVLKKLEGLGVEKEDAARAADLYRESRAELKGIDAEKPEAPEEVDPSKYGMDECRAQVFSLREELDKSKSLKKGTCPTCGSPVKARPVETIREQLQKWESRLAKAKDAESYTQKKIAYEKELQVYTAAKERKAKLQQRVDKYRAGYEAHLLWQELPARPAKVSKPDPADDADDQLARAEELYQLYLQLEPVRQMIENYLHLTDKQREAATKVNTLVKKMQDLTAKVADLQSRLTLATSARETLSTLRERGRALAESVADEDVVKALLDIYSKKGIKKIKIQRYAQVIQDQLNKYKSLLYSENFHFEIRYDTQLRILVHRRGRKRTYTSDVRKLSGAESMVFTLLLLLAQMVLTPKHRRLNILILDEPTANMGPEMIAAFSRFLPILNKVIPHIIIITPRTDENYAGARTFTVVKKGGVSKLVEGRC